MTELDQPADRTTQINHIKVLPENQDALVRAMTQNLDHVMVPAPGFISSTILKSIDGERVVNVVQWTTPELLDSVHETSAFKDLLKTYKAFVIEGGPKLYTIAESRQAAPSSEPEEPLALYVMPGSCALASHIAMIWAGIPYDLKLVSHDDLASDAFLAINPKGAVPALSFGDGSTLRESLAILSYVADLDPRARLGAETVVERARLNEILAELVSGVHSSWAPVFVPERYVLDDANQEDARAAAFARIDEQYAYLDKRLGDQDWLLFGRRTVADAYLYVMCSWKDKSLTPLSEYPALKRFMERLDADDGVRRALSEEFPQSQTP